MGAVEIPHSVGLEVWIRDETGNRRLRVDSCMGIPTLGDFRNHHWKWPLFRGNQDQVRELTRGENAQLWATKTGGWKSIKLNRLELTSCGGLPLSLFGSDLG